MAQIIKRNGKDYSFPNDASLDEINGFFKEEFQSNLSKSIKDFFKPSMPFGVNVATGLMSLAYPHEEAELVKNLPQALLGKEPGISEKIAHFVGESLPGIGGGGPAAKGAVKTAGKGIEYIQPQKSIEKFMEKIGEGARTSEENIGNIALDTTLGRIEKQEAALVPKREVMEAAKGKHLYSNAKIEKQDVNKIADLFGLKGLNETQEKAIVNYLEKYYKKLGHSTKPDVKIFNELTSNLQNILKSGEHFNQPTKVTPEINRELYNLTKSMRIKSGKYLSQEKNLKGYSEDLVSRHKSFVENPNAETADKLLSELKEELRRTPKTKDVKRSRLINDISNLTQDFEGFVKTLPEKAQGKYKQFTEAWKESEKMYNEQGEVIKELSKLNPQGISKANVQNAFANPTKQTIKMLNEVDPKLRGRVLYNLLVNIDESNAKTFANAILDAKKTKGYSQYVTKDIEDFAYQLLKRHRAREFAKDLGLFTGVSMTPIGPLGGAATVAGRHALPYVSKALGKMFGK